MEQLFYLAFAIFPGVGPAKFQLLVEKFETAEKAWNESQENLTSALGEKLAGELVDFRKRFDPEKYAKELGEKEIGWVTLVDEEYPKLLRKMTLVDPPLKSPPLEGKHEVIALQNQVQERVLSNNRTVKQLNHLKSPFVLFYKGNKSLFSEQKTIGIVGTRSISSYGREVTAMLTRELVEQGFVIVSGLALGVDGVAHETCLDTHGKTIAVLGSGVDMCTPSNHQKLYDRILASEGLIVSTVPPGEEPNKGSFPARNKIIAGLSLGVILTEGAADSGALYTADFAKDMGRPVFAVPGPITSKLSAATTKLLKDGAFLITSGQDVIDRLGIMNKVKTQNSKVKSLKSDSPEEQAILDLLQFEPLHFNEIVRKIGKDSSTLGSLLSLMELKGMVKSSGEKYSLQ